MKNIKNIVLVVLLAMIFLAAAKLKEIEIQELSDYTCQPDSGWRFEITGDGYPPTIHVEFKDGTETDVPLDNVTDGTAHYYLDAGEYVKALMRVSAWVADSWNGEFIIAQGPCTTDVGVISFSARSTSDARPVILALIIICAFFMGFVYGKIK